MCPERGYIIDNNVVLETAVVRRARYAVSTGFMIFGLFAGLWFVHIPVVVARLGLEPAVLGMALLTSGVGSLIFQPLAGILVGKLGSKRSALLFLVGSLLVFPIPISAVNTPMLFIGLFLFGAIVGATNVAINTQASEIEKARRRPLMSMFHGFFSLGALCSAVIGAYVIGKGWGSGLGAIVVAGLLMPFAIAASTRFLPTPEPEIKETKKTKFSMPAPTLLGLAVLAFITNTVEFSVNDWSALYLKTEMGMKPSAAGTGFALFSVAMVVSRFAGGRVIERMGPRNVLLVGGILIAIGMSIVLGSIWPELSIFGFFLIGMGAANLVPLLLSEAGRLPGISPSMGVAVTATGLTSGILIGPPVIGFAAQAFGLPMALGFVVVFGVVIAISATLRTWHSG